ncbi:MAG: GHKL domain-containing protein [Erysipelotrichales bacterium]|nr:GHKL domain-containing protein [Erysipelotrichales bacterium]
MMSFIFSSLDYLEIFFVFKYLYTFRMRKMYICILLILVFGCVNYFISSFGLVNIFIVEVLLFLMDLCFIFFCVKKYKLLDCLIGISLYLVSLICTVSVVSFFQMIYSEFLNTIGFPFINHFIRIVVYYLLAKQVKIKLIDYGTVKIRNIYIMMIPVVFLIFLLFEGYFVYGQSTYYIFIMFMSIVMGITTFYVMYKQYIVEVENDKLKLLEKILDYSNEQHQLLMENEKEIRKIKHDMLNNLSIVSALSIEGKNKEVQEFLLKLIGDIGVIKSITYCNQQYINALLNLKVANNSDILFEYEIGFFELTQEMEFDSCTIVSNLLDNSIEEIRRDFTNKKEIKLTMKEMNSNLFITVENDMHKSKSLFTEKENNVDHGMGLSIVQKLVNKYQGIIDINQSDKFKISLFLKK